MVDTRGDQEHVPDRDATVRRDPVPEPSAQAEEVRLVRALAIAFEEDSAHTGEFGIRHSEEMPVTFDDELRSAVHEFTRASRAAGRLPEHVIIRIREVARQSFTPRHGPDSFGRVMNRCVRWSVESYFERTTAARDD